LFVFSFFLSSLFFLSFFCLFFVSTGPSRK
jgi:hypothetical protein